jgi:hypothetical protein
MKDIVVAARAKLAAVATSRDAAKTFVAHDTNIAFEQAPAGIEKFEIEGKEHTPVAGFGVTGQKEARFNMVVKIGVAPYARDDVRENNTLNDIERVTDILEGQAWWPALMQMCLHNKTEVNKDAANWWILTLTFAVTYHGDIRS